MLTSFFASSKPIHSIVVMVYMSLAYFWANGQLLFGEFSWQNIVQVIGCWILYIVALLVFSFIIQKNELTQATSYKTVLFGVFTAALPALFSTPYILLSGLCVLIALRRIISLRSGLVIERKLFDAAFWLTIASLFYFWSGFFFAILFLSIFLYVRTQLRYWFIPLLGIGVVGVFICCYVLYIGDDQSYILKYIDSVAFNFSAYSTLGILISLTFLTGVLFWCIWRYFAMMSATVFSQRGSYILIMSSIIVALIIIILAPDKTGAEWYFLIPFLTIVAANYVEQTTNKFFTEFLLWVAIVIPVVVNII